MKPLKSIVICYILFSSLVAMGQELGKVRIVTVPPLNELYFKLGDSLLTSPIAVLPVGEYEVQMWAPSCLPFDTTLVVYPDSVTYFRKVMELTPEYVSYEQDLKQYNRQVRLPKIISIDFSALMTVGSYFLYRNAKTKLDDVYALEEEIQTIPFEGIEDYYKSYDKKKSEYKKAKNTYHVAQVATAISWGVTTYFFLKHRKTNKPNFTPQQAPFSISLIPSFNPNSNQVETFTCLTYALEF